MKAPLSLIAKLSMLDLLYERRLTICSVVALSAVLLPLIVLWGLKSGIVEGLRADLVENPRTKTIANQSNRSFTPDFLKGIASRPDVIFVAPRLRTLNSEARFENAGRPSTSRRAELLATGVGDPLLGNVSAPGANEVILSASLADRLGVKQGETVKMSVFRSRNKDVLTRTLLVKGVAPVSSIGRDSVFADLPLLVEVDDFLEGKNAAEAGAAPPPARTFAGFRVHARHLEDVLALEAYFHREDVDVETHATEIAGLLQLDRSLTLLFSGLAGLGAAGCFIYLGVGLYAAVERKQSELSLLRLVGMPGRALVYLPVTQATAIALAGSTLAATLAIAVGVIVNKLPLGASTSRPVCLIEGSHLVFAACASVAGAAVAAAFAARLAAHISPAEGIRHV